MSTVFQITDQKGTVLNIRVIRNNWGGPAYQWKPLFPGLVRAPDDYNTASRVTWDTNSDDDASYDQLLCVGQERSNEEVVRAFDQGNRELGPQLKYFQVLSLHQCFTFKVFFKNSGSGWLFREGVLEMKAGPMTWKAL